MRFSSIPYSVFSYDRVVDVFHWKLEGLIVPFDVRLVTQSGHDGCIWNPSCGTSSHVFAHGLIDKTSHINRLSLYDAI